jgi:hypothetical protein
MGKECSALDLPFAGEVEADFDESRADRRLGGLGGVGFFMDRAFCCRIEIGIGFGSIKLHRPRSVEQPSGAPTSPALVNSAAASACWIMWYPRPRLSKAHSVQPAKRAKEKHGKQYEPAQRQHIMTDVGYRNGHKVRERAITGCHCVSIE